MSTPGEKEDDSSAIDSSVEEAKAKEFRPRCLADQLWDPLRYVAQRPKETAIVHALLNSIFIGIGKLVSTTVYYITWPGFILLLIVLFYFLALKLARSIVYPMSNRTVMRSQEDAAAKYSKSLLLKSLRRSIKYVESVQNLPATNWNGMADSAFQHHLKLAFENLAKECTQSIGPVIRTLEVYCEHFAPSTQGGIGENSDVQENTHTKACELLRLLKLVVVLEDRLRAKLLVPESDLRDAPRGYLGALVTSVFHDDALPTESAPLLDATGDIEFLGTTLLVALREAASLSPCLSAPCKAAGEEKEEDAGGLSLGERAIKTGRKYLGQVTKARQPYEGVASFHFLRASMLSALSAEQAWVTAPDGTRIDTMFVPCATAGADNRTVILCNPNAAVYEQLAMQPDTIRLYNRLGFHALVFNYRGYGRSAGAPSPSSLCADIEAIARYLVDCRHVALGCIAVHGESIGGLVATHLARRAEDLGVFLLVADRTFSSLPDTADALVGAWAGTALRRLLRWEADNVEDYLLAPGYKVLTCDPDDEIIAHTASLKMGVVRELLREARTAAGRTVTTCLADGTNWSGTAGQYLVNRTGAWLAQGELAERFVMSVQNIVKGLERCANGEVKVSYQFATDLRQALHILWFVDGRCGQHLGLAYHAHKAEAEASKSEDATPEEKSKDTSEEISAMQLWMASFIIFGPTTPKNRMPHSELKEIYQRSAMLGIENRIRMWSLAGENGLYGEENPIPMNTALRVLSEFYRQHRSSLERVGALEAFGFITETLEKLIVSFDANKSLPSEIENTLGHLIPLTCGHNGVMSPAEEETLVYHIKCALATNENLATKS